jgi:hypothetical protein
LVQTHTHLPCLPPEGLEHLGTGVALKLLAVYEEQLELQLLRSADDAVAVVDLLDAQLHDVRALDGVPTSNEEDSDRDLFVLGLAGPDVRLGLLLIQIFVKQYFGCLNILRVVSLEHFASEPCGRRCSTHIKLHWNHRLQFNLERFIFLEFAHEGVHDLLSHFAGLVRNDEVEILLSADDGSQQLADQLVAAYLALDLLALLTLLSSPKR